MMDVDVRKKRKIGKNYVGSKLLNRLVISAITVPAVFGIAVYEIFLEQTGATLAIVGSVLGAIIGLALFGRSVQNILAC